MHNILRNEQNTQPQYKYHPHFHSLDIHNHHFIYIPRKDTTGNPIHLILIFFLFIWFIILPSQTIKAILSRTHQ